MRLLGVVLLSTACSRPMNSEAIAPDRTGAWRRDAGAPTEVDPPEPMPVAPAAAPVAITPEVSPGEGVASDAGEGPDLPAPVPSPVPGPVDASAPDLVVTSDVAPDVRPAVPPDLVRGRVGHWRLDETMGNAVADSSPIGNHGGTVGIVNEDWRPAKLGNGLSFTPARRSFVQVGAHDTLNPPRSLSVAMWINARSWDQRPCLLQKGDPDEQFGLIVQNGRVQFFVRLIDGTIARATTPPPAVGQWAHLAAVYDGQNAQLFLGGVVVATVAAPGRPLVAFHNLSLGGRLAATEAEFFPGMLDEVLLYNRALSLDEVALLASGKVP